MNRMGFVGLVVLGSTLTVGEAQAFSASYDQKVTHGRDVINSKVVMRDEMFRVESTVEGETAVTIRNQEGVYSYLPKEGMAMKLPGVDPSQQPVPNASDYQGYLRERHAELIRSETVNGQLCDVYRFTDPAIQGTTTAWVWKEKGFPVRLEITEADGKTVVELTNIQLGAAMQESAFRLPPDVKVMDVGSMMDGVHPRKQEQ